METLLKLEINAAERELLLEGLRFVKRARMLAFREGDALPYPHYDEDLNAVAELVERLHGDATEAVEAPSKPR